MDGRMRIGIFSDTHGWLDPGLVSDFSDCQEIWHAGDIGASEVLDAWPNEIKIRAVYGNIDGGELRHSLPEFQVFSVQGFRVLLLHIAGKHPGYSPLAHRLIREYHPGMLVCGHSHICRVVKEGNILYVNPGAAGRHGFHKVRTALKIDFENGKPFEVRVLELGPRSERFSAAEES